MLKFEHKLDRLVYSYFCCIMLLFPFVLLLKHLGYETFFLVIIGIYFIIKLLTLVTTEIKFSVTLLPTILAGVIIVSLIYIYHLVTYGEPQMIHFIRYFSFSFILLFLFLFDYNAYRFAKYHLMYYVLYIFVLLCAWLIVDFVLLNIFNMDPMQQLMWVFHSKYRMSVGSQLIFTPGNLVPQNLTQFHYSSSFVCSNIIQIVMNKNIIDILFGVDWRPLGLIGQPSVTSSNIIFLYLIYRYISFSDDLYKSNYLNILLFSILTLTILLQNSGLGFVLYLAMIFLMMLTSKKKWRFIALLFPLIFFILISSNYFYRISFSYILYVVELIYHSLSNYIKHLTVSGFLFGVRYPFYEGGSGYLFMLSSMGVFYFIYYYSFIFRIAIKENKKWLTIALAILTLSDFHYTSSFYYPLTPLLIAFLAIRIYLTDESYNFTLKKFTLRPTVDY